MSLNRQQRRQMEREQRKLRKDAGAVGHKDAGAVGHASSGWTRARPAPSPSRDPPADKVALLERFDNFAPLRNGLRGLADGRQDWAGIPMPLDGQRLVIEPSFPKAAALSMIGAPPEEPLPDGVRLRNRWWSRQRQAEVYVYEEDGKVRCATLPFNRRLSIELNTLGCSFAWGIEQEGRAVQTLGTLLRHHQFKQYLITGMFLESSTRSGLTYLFRKLRPTVVLDARSGDGARTRALCALCLHPIGYYADSWAGAMTPTDEVIAHLMLMRGDEPMFWRRANQHAPWRPEAGL